jgi:hypothetical protein
MASPEVCKPSESGRDLTLLTGTQSGQPGTMQRSTVTVTPGMGSRQVAPYGSMGMPMPQGGET